MAKELNGQMVTELRDMKSVYSNNCLKVIIDKKEYYLHVNEIMKLMNENVKFRPFKKITKSPRVYLEITEH